MKESYLLAKEQWIKTNKSISAIAKEYHIDRQSFSSFLKKEGIWEDRRIKYKTNRSYFKDIDSPTKAYLIGFIAADGCIICNSDKSAKGLDIALQKSDKDFLKSLDILLGNDGSRVKETENVFDLRIISSEIANDLVSIGITPKKSLTLDLSKLKVDKNFLVDLIRGYFDGDGCFFMKNYEYGERELINFTGTIESINFIKETLMKNCGCSKGTITKRHPNDSNNYTIQWQGKNQVAQIIKYLLSSKSELTLQRKTEKMKSFIELSNV